MLSGTEKDTLSKIIHTMDQYPELDLAYGRRRLKDDGIVPNDLLFMKYLISLNKEHILRLRDMKEMIKPGVLLVGNSMMTGGGNTIFTAESYALAGGYDRGLNQDSDRGLGVRIIRLRDENGEPNAFTVGNIEAVSYADPTRFIRGVAERIQDTPPTQSNVSPDELMRQLSAKLNRFAALDDSNKSVFESLLNAEYTSLQNALKDPVQADPLMWQILDNLGFTENDYHVELGEIKVANWDRVKEKLSELRKIHESASQAAA
jgi:hypothetical protein